MATRVGILGGGQLGRMLLQSGIDFPVDFYVLDPDPAAACASLTSHFTVGALTDFDTVYQFGRQVEVLTIEIENVNVDALEKLQAEGVKVYPQPHVIRTIQDKRLQKQFYHDHQIPTPDFVLVENREAVAWHLDFLPAFHKLGREGYDGRGVVRLDAAQDLSKAFDKPGLLEKAVDIDKELAVLVARNPQGEVKMYPPVELVANPTLHLLDYLLAPALIDEAVVRQVEDIAYRVVHALDMVGLLAIELFLDKQGKVWVNEAAPRPHNSGHHTMRACYTSQFEQLLRAILGYPLGATDALAWAAMINLLGAEAHQGEAVYEGLDKALAQKGVSVHLYGKKITKPGRKMGHIVVLEDSNLQNLLLKLATVKNQVRVVSIPESESSKT
ncbi:MAG TPA: 5-(carboxyamino)imidazole ribonucleotide synthase [Microscillaceae bacterium]|nr:5-(carboxyamino)imidazole ribonucleotide synthase [Microscillaceae bacterium]